MIHLIVARHNDEIYKTYLEASLEKFNGQDILVHCIKNDENCNSMFSKYNKGIEIAKPQDEDILVFVHEDVKILDENFFKKLELVFNKKSEVGLIGIVGTKELVPTGWWSNDHKHHVGHWYQEYENGTQRHMIRKIGFDSDMVAVDGCVFAVRGKVAKGVKFQEELYPNSFHFYDYSYCISVLEVGWKVAVADISILHKSEGALPPEWHKAKDIFYNNMISRGYTFPITLNQALRGLYD